MGPWPPKEGNERMNERMSWKKVAQECVCVMCVCVCRMCVCVCMCVWMCACATRGVCVCACDVCVCSRVIECMQAAMCVRV